MSELKKLSPKKQPNNELNFRQGFNFGLGFMTAVFIFSFVIIPAMACSAAIVLAAMGQSLPAG